VRVWWLVGASARMQWSALTLLSCAALGPVQHSHVWPCVAHVLFVHAFTHRFAPVNATTSVFFDETNKQVCVCGVCSCHPLFILLRDVLATARSCTLLPASLHLSSARHVRVHLHVLSFPNTCVKRTLPHTHSHSLVCTQTQSVFLHVVRSARRRHFHPIRQRHAHCADSSRDPNDHLRLRCAGVCGSRRVARSAGQVARNL
jgi:hypothetical protein